MVKKHPDLNSGLAWLGTILQYIKDYGVFNIIKAIILLFILSITLRLVWNPELIFEKYSQYLSQKHNIELNERAELDQQVKAMLPTFLYKYHASRVWIIQYHNGIKDWQHGTMRFEKCDQGIISVKEQYNNFNLTWLNIPYYLKENEDNVFIGGLEELQTIDDTLYTQFKKNKVSYLACTLIKDNIGNPIGIFGVTWEHLDIDIQKLNPKILRYLIEDRITIGDIIK